MVFQDPFSSINPVFRISHGILRSLKLHRPDLSDAAAAAGGGRGSSKWSGLTPGHEMLQRYPYELSGGQRQRVGFAQALATRPKLILADEPVSMLDVSIRIGLLNLMAQLRDTEGVSILYITHDIASARYVADRLIVMYAGPDRRGRPGRGGAGPPEAPVHPAAAVRGARPAGPAGRAGAGPTGASRRRSSTRTPGCRFRWRCPLAIDECEHTSPRQLRELLPGTRPPATWPSRRRK